MRRNTIWPLQPRRDFREKLAAADVEASSAMQMVQARIAELRKLLQAQRPEKIFSWPLS